MHRRGWHPALHASGGARGARPAALARSAGQSDARRLPRGRSPRAAPPPLRADARSRARRDGRARRRARCELGRQGGEERRRLRPRQAVLGLARDARHRRSHEPEAPPAAEGFGDVVVSTGDGEAKAQAIRRSTLVPSALDVAEGRVAVLFEGSAAAVEVQVGAAQGARRRRASRPGGLGRGAAAAERSRPVVPNALLARLGAELDPKGVFV